MLLGAIGSGTMPAPKRAEVVARIGGQRGTRAVELHLGGLRLRSSHEHEQAEAEHEGKAE